METNTVNTQWTDESILGLIRQLRNDLIKDFLDERFLKDYLAEHFNVRELSSTKIEFIKKELKEMLISPVDTGHFQPLINQIRLTDSAALTETNEKLFYRQIEAILKKYIY